METLLSVLPWRASAFFYGTHGGAEVDLVVEHGDGELWAMEIKRSLAAKVSRGFHEACAESPPGESIRRPRGRGSRQLRRGSVYAKWRRRFAHVVDRLAPDDRVLASRRLSGGAA